MPARFCMTDYIERQLQNFRTGRARPVAAIRWGEPSGRAAPQFPQNHVPHRISRPRLAPDALCGSKIPLLYSVLSLIVAHKSPLRGS